ncbi:unnamed protein product [Diabrotica balteata]|uniref:Uncharacterized protein n=1 Tax=Diabrotica balteata TaxID=107213 RepID=A0A9N9SQI8_DIABA|nr:unnamed protein product [Diabrotica balteata]
MDHCGVKKRSINPRQTANLFSLLTFTYSWELIKRAYQHGLSEDDLYEVVKNCRSKFLGKKLEKDYVKQQQKKNPKSVFLILWQLFGLKYFLVGCFDLCFRIARSYLEPDALSNLIFFFSEGQTRITRSDAYYYLAIVLFFNYMVTLIYDNMIVYFVIIGIQIRTAFSSFLYRKALKLSPTALAEISVGNIVTLITKDVQTFEKGIWTINHAWIGIVHCSVVTYLLYCRIGITTLAGIVLYFLIIPVQLYLGNILKKFRIQTNRYTDQRLQIFQEALSVIKIIKMYTWEDYFLGKVDTARKLEIKKMLGLLYLRIAVETTGLLVSKLGFYLLVMAYVWINDEADATTVFFIMSNYGTISYTLGILIPDCITTSYEFLSTTTRLNLVLRAKELPIPKLKEKTSRPTIHIKDATVSLGKENILNNISLKVIPGLTLVTGQVGSGKSSLLKLMLQSYSLTAGNVCVEGRISYASQDPWLFPSSIKQNILFGQDLDPKRYADVLRVCALEFDLKMLEKGDETILIDKGSNLSKGQQARINLARAVYRISDIYLLDDCLTALDNEVQDYIFNECIQTFLKGKICVLVTQTERHIKQSDVVVIMKNGEIFKTTKPTNKSLKEIKDINTVPNENIKENEKIENENNENKKLLEAEQTVEQRKKVYEETIQKGSVSYKNYKKYFGFGGFALMVIYCIVCGGFQFAQSYSDKLLTKWVDDQQQVINLKAKLMQHDITPHGPHQNKSFTLLRNGKVLKEDMKDFNFININNVSNSINEFKNVNIINSNLTKENITHQFDKSQERAKNTFKWYYIMLFSGAVMDIIKTGIIYDICRRASINLHYALVKNILNAVMNFFDTHFIGNILNRLSQDLVMMDERLGYILNESFGVIYMMCGTVILIVSVNNLFIFYTVFVIICLVTLGRIYLPFNRNMKRLEASTRSPMIGHLNATLEGITTVRAYNAENILTDEFDRHHDLFTSTYYTRNVYHRAYGFCASFLSTTLLTMLILTFIFMDTGASAGDVGLALSQAFLLGSFIASAVNVYTDLETMMTSVERVFEYTDIETEKQDGTLVTGWPKKGSISYEYVSLTYNKTDHILKNVSFEVKSNEKIGIIGRTGAGKSSLISTIFRLYEIHGKILVDKVDIKTLPLKTLRKNIAIIPQDPVLFSGTIRSNLDPFNKFNDEELWSAIDKANLKGFITELDSKIMASSSSLSLGQKQMFCVARAILSNAKIIVLDEATANMDNETQTLVNKSIKDNFSACTILTIAHRLENIVDSDKILVMDRGEVREYDNPEQLLKNKESYFSKMVQKSVKF